MVADYAVKRFIKNSKIMLEKKSCNSEEGCAWCPLEHYDMSFNKADCKSNAACLNMVPFSVGSTKLYWLKQWLKKYERKKQLEFDF